MTQHFHYSFLIQSVIATLLMTSVLIGSAKAADVHTTMGDEKIREYVGKARGIIYAPSLTQGSLLQMRGAFGRAYFTRKAEDNSWCDAAPLRMLFGDFDGTSLGISNPGSVVLMVISPFIADKLAKGQDVVGEDVTLLDIGMVPTEGLQGIDIIIAGSASAESGLILNPGRSILSDIFGASSVDNACGHVSAETALTTYEAAN